MHWKVVFGELDLWSADDSNGRYLFLQSAVLAIDPAHNSN